MNFRLPARLALLAAAVGLPLALPQAVQAAGDDLMNQARATFKPIAAPKVTSDAKIELGRKLFFEPRLSKSGALSCNSCHNLASYGVDNLSTSVGHKAQLGGRNSPTVFNAGVHVAQFWDGRAQDLKAQAKGPVLNPVEMAMESEAATVERLRSIPAYEAEFRKAFPGQKASLSYDNMAAAIAAFEATLVTPSRFDRFLGGDAKALTAQERKGLKTFMDKGCASCHSGIGLGGGSYMKFGLVKPYANQKDLGRFELTRNEADKHVFKVPSLRNIAHTYPYFHDGQVWQLDEAVRIMGETQLGQKLSAQETQAIVSFLHSLTGEISPAALKLPVLPPSGPKTSKPAM